MWTSRCSLYKFDIIFFTTTSTPSCSQHDECNCKSQAQVEAQLEAKGALLDKLENEKIDLERGTKGRVGGLGGFAAERQHRLEREKLQKEIDQLKKKYYFCPWLFECSCSILSE